MPIKPIEINGEKCYPRFGKYRNDRVGIFFYTTGGETMLKATVNLTHMQQFDLNNVVAKDKECCEYLMEAGVAELIIGLEYEVPYIYYCKGNGYNSVGYLMKLLVNPEDYVEYLV